MVKFLAAQFPGRRVRQGGAVTTLKCSDTGCPEWAEYIWCGFSVCAEHMDREKCGAPMLGGQDVPIEPGAWPLATGVHTTQGAMAKFLCMLVGHRRFLGKKRLENWVGEVYGKLTKEVLCWRCHKMLYATTSSNQTSTSG